MVELGPLRGSCSCGRNHYVIDAANDATSTFSITHDDHSQHSYGLSLRIPLVRIRSTTYAHFPDETHQVIRRVFSHPHAPNSKRHFCGFCGTYLSYWTEVPASEAQFVLVNLGSFRGESLSRLKDAGLFDDVQVQQEHRGQNSASVSEIPNAGVELGYRDAWDARYEDLLNSTDVGLTRRGASSISADGRAIYEWEIIEISPGNADSIPPDPKRRL